MSELLKIVPKDCPPFRQCEMCGNEQGDLGDDVSCESCGECKWSGPYCYPDAERVYLDEDYTHE